MCLLLLCLSVFCFFFFSSRRRHTRCLSDWSSDVCSSDLRWDQVVVQVLGAPRHVLFHQGEPQALGNRSEERRVGKECRYRWWPDVLKKRQERSKNKRREKDRLRRREDNVSTEQTCEKWHD